MGYLFLLLSLQQMIQPTLDQVDISLQTFETLEDATEFALNSAMSSGYCLSTRNSSMGKAKGTYLRLACTLRSKTSTKAVGLATAQHQNVDEVKETRQSRTKSCDCKYAITFGQRNQRWFIKPSKHNHNHDPLPQEELTAYPQRRTLNLESERRFTVLADANTSSSFTSKALIKNSNVTFRVDIKNKKARIRRALDEGVDNADKMQRLFWQLEQNDYIVVKRLDEQGHLTHLFFAHVSVIEMVKITRRETHLSFQK